MADGVRGKVSIGLAEALAGDIVPSEEEGLALAALADTIERAMFATFGGTTKDYKSKYRTLLFNLKDEKNPTLRTRVREGELSVETLITADAKALASDVLKTARQEMQERYFAARQQVDGEMLVGWQAGTRGSLATHKNTDVNKLGTAAVVEASSGGPTTALLDEYADFLRESAPGAEHEREGTPVPMADGGTPLHDGGAGEDDGAGGAGDGAAQRLDDDDIWGVNDDDSPEPEPPAKAQKLDAGAAARPPPLSVSRAPPPAAHAPTPKRAPPPTSPTAAGALPPALPAVKAALRGTEWLLPADHAQLISDDALLRERIARAYAVRERVCGVPSPPPLPAA
ncbi:hypothetical protein KFE25_002883 [Diacronema lutheri]|uniref:TFIIS central domain-containing protein n=1 Tax=Diacronema lutheri TaxID=2081491 RepID=A0A8J6CBZ7_DIALT|nr:hypothetical protein KFE25_002883 [Diacronema lutheri]